MTNYARMYRFGITPWERYATAAAPSIATRLDREEAERSRPLGRALDLGCGRGRYTPELARRGWEAAGIDAVPAAIEAAITKNRGVDGLSFVVGDVTQLPAARLGTFDFFLDIGCFQGLDAQQRRSEAAGVVALPNPGATMLLLSFGPGRWRPLVGGASRGGHRHRLRGLGDARGRAGRHGGPGLAHEPDRAAVVPATPAGLEPQIIGMTRPDRMAYVRAMAGAHVRSFSEDDIPAAGALLAARHRAHRLSCRLLSPRYEQEPAATEQVAATFALPGASGAVAMQGDDIAGFLLGAPKDSPVWGPNVWVDAAGQAAAEPELVRDLYELAAARWVQESRRAQYVLVPASDESLLRAWYRLGFGQQQALAVRPLPNDERPVAPTRITLRRARRTDLPDLARLELELPRHQSLAPTFSASPVPSYAECLAGWEEDFDDPAYTTFVAEFEGAVIGSSIGCSLELTSSHPPITRPERAAFLAFAAVRPPARGLGAGRALGEAVIAWSAQAGYECVVTDWRVTNLLSSRTWPRLGFVESFLRLHRLVGY